MLKQIANPRNRDIHPLICPGKVFLKCRICFNKSDIVMEFINHNTIKHKHESLFQLLNQYKPLNKYSADGRTLSQKGNRPVSDLGNVPSHSEYIFNIPISGLYKENMVIM